MCKGSSQATSTAQTTTAPNPQAMAAYQQLLGRANAVSQTPYTPYGGELVAPVNQQQYAGIGGINNYANSAQPYLQSAAGMAYNAAQPITSDQINQYMSPYTQDVVNATQAQFNNQNAQQNQQVKGNAISQGALGGNREGIAEAELANQQNLAQAPVIANLQNQGYQTGLNTALTEQNAGMQGAYGLANIGQGIQNSGLTGANAQIGAGSLEQGTQQAQDQALYGQFMNQQAYPYQQLSWLAGLDTGVGSQMGGSSSTVSTPAPPSIWTEMAGLGSAGMGIAGLAGLFSTGGAVPGFADGGGVAGPAWSPTVPESPATLRLQQKHLVSGHRQAQLFPHGSPELPVPHGMTRTQTHLGPVHHDPRRVSGDHVRNMVGSGREHELLGLGPVSKHEILHRIRGGEIPVGIVERHHDGTEVRAAIGTHVTAPHQFAEMHRTKAPESRIHVEHPAHVIAHRLAGGRVRGYDDGGGVAGPSLNLMGGSPYAGGAGFIPQMNITHGPGAPKPPQAPGQAPGIGDQLKQIGSMAKTLAGLNKNKGVADPMPTSDQSFNPTPAGDIMPEAPAASTDGLLNGIYHRGGGVRGRDEGGGVADDPLFSDDSGSLVDDSGDGPSSGVIWPSEKFIPNDQQEIPLPRSRPPEVDADQYNGVHNARGDHYVGSTAPPEGLTHDNLVGSMIRQGIYDKSITDPPTSVLPDNTKPEPKTMLAKAAAPFNDPAIHVSDVQPKGLNAYDGDRDETSGLATPVSYRGHGRNTGVAPPVDTSGVPAGETPKKAGFDWSSDNKLWPALMSAGFGMMSSRSPYPLVGIGEGGTQGLAAYSGAQQQENQNKLKQEEIQQKAQKMAADLDFRERQLSQPKLTTDETGRPILVNPKTGATVPITTDPVQAQAPGRPTSPTTNVAAGDAGNPAAAGTTPPPAGTGVAAGSDDPEQHVSNILASDAKTRDKDLPGTNPEVLEGMTPEDAAQVRAISQGREKFPTATGKNAQHVNYIMGKVRLYDQGADGTDFARRQRVANNFAVGTQGGGGQQITAFNRWAQHSAQLLDDYKKLDNGEWTFAQKGINAFAANTPWDKTRRDLLRRIEVDRAAVAAEGAKVMAGSNTSLKDREHWLELFPSTMPYHEAQAAMSAQAHLVDGAIDALTGQYNSGMKTNHSPVDFMTPSTRQRMPFLRGEAEAPGEGKKPSGGAEKPAKGETPTAVAAPPVSMLKEGEATKMKNGLGTWTLKDGKPVKVGD